MGEETAWKTCRVMGVFFEAGPVKGAILLALRIRTIFLAQRQHKLALKGISGRANVKFCVYMS